MYILFRIKTKWLSIITQQHLWMHSRSIYTAIRLETRLFGATWQRQVILHLFITHAHHINQPTKRKGYPTTIVWQPWENSTTNWFWQSMRWLIEGGTRMWGFSSVVASLKCQWQHSIKLNQHTALFFFCTPISRIWFKTELLLDFPRRKHTKKHSEIGPRKKTRLEWKTETTQTPTHTYTLAYKFGRYAYIVDGRKGRALELVGVARQSQSKRRQNL